MLNEKRRPEFRRVSYSQYISLLAVFLSLTQIVASAPAASPLKRPSAYVDSAYIHLYHQMDTYHRTFDVYTDMDAGGNHFTWIKTMNEAALLFDPAWTIDLHSGVTCTRCEYISSLGSWTGVRWAAFPPGHYLTGADTCYYWARGETGGEIIKIEIGGELGDPTHVMQWDTLTTEWIQYNIPIPPTPLDSLKGGFTWYARIDENPNGCTFYLDDIKYNYARLDSPRFIQSYIPTDYLHDQEWALNQAYTYDNAMSMIAFVAQDSLERAKLIGDAFRYAQNNDRIWQDGRLRNAYRTGDIADHVTGEVLLPGWWDSDSTKWFEDSYQVGTYTGEMAWVIIAWLTYDQNMKQPVYLSSAESLANWIYDSCYVATEIPGYTGGYLGPDDSPQREEWKSTEHNIDVYVAFMRLYQVTGDTVWSQRAQLALEFVEALWDSTTGHFYGGTDGTGQINEFSPLDAQTWGLLASLDTSAYERAISWAEDSCSVNTPGWEGFHFSTVRDGIWWEGTAQMCCAFQVLGDTATSDIFLNELRDWQTSAPNGNGRGIVACHPDSIWTGIDRSWGRWYYYNRLHGGATAWYIFAERSYNPYWHPLKSIENLSVFLSCSDIFLGWEPIGGATHYRIYRDTIFNCQPSVVNLLDSTSHTFFLDHGATGNFSRHYFYRIIATNDVIQSKPSICVGEFDRYLQNN
jgi:hypothetical protein